MKIFEVCSFLWVIKLRYDFGNQMDLLLGLAETQVESEYVHYFFTGKGTYMEKYKTRNGDGEESGRTMK